MSTQQRTALLAAAAAARSATCMTRKQLQPLLGWQVHQAVMKDHWDDGSIDSLTQQLYCCPFALVSRYGALMLVDCNESPMSHGSDMTAVCCQVVALESS
jgi:hypothetical protein